MRMADTKWCNGPAMAVILAISLLTAGAVSAQDMPNRLEQRVKDAVVSIVVTYADIQGRPVGVPARGHGVVLGKDGLILTAAHVVLPLRSNLILAQSYRISIRHWDSETESWGPGKTLDSSFVSENLIVSGELQVEDCRPSELVPKMPCLSEEPDRRVDYAILRAAAEEDRFVDVMGPFDQLNRTILDASDWIAFAVSDFFREDALKFTVLEPTSEVEAHVFETQDNREFDKGISGSPIFLFDPGNDPAVFLLGLAAESRRSSVHQVNTVLLQEFLHEHLTEVNAWSQVVPVFRCDRSAAPYEHPLLDNFRNYGVADLSRGDRKRITKCLQKHQTWWQTAALANNDAILSGIVDAENSVNSLGFGGAPTVGTIETAVLLNTDLDRALAEIVAAADEEGIPPDAALKFAAYQASSNPSANHALSSAAKALKTSTPWDERSRFGRLAIEKSVTVERPTPRIDGNVNNN